MWSYCSKADVAEICGLSEDSMNDSWSATVEGLIDDHTGNQYGESVTYTESIDGDGTDTIFLQNSPVTSVTSLSIGGTSIPASGFAVYRSGHVRLVSGNPTSALGKVIGDYKSSFPVGQQNVSITYVAHEGYVPPTIRLAAMLMVAEFAIVRERGGADGSLAVSRATQRAGESNRGFRDGTNLAGRLKNIMINTLGEKWRFE